MLKGRINKGLKGLSESNDADWFGLMGDQARNQKKACGEGVIMRVDQFRSECML